MAVVIRMPKMSDTMTEGVIASWLVKVGDTVKPGDVLAEVETDKATMELENYEKGTLLYIGVQEKEAIAVDGIIAVIGQPGEDFQSLIGGGAPQAAPAPAAPAPTSTAQPAAVATAPAADLSSIKAAVIRMPKMSDTMTEGVIASWLVKVGDTVKPGDILAEVETDKATMELENYEKGTVLYIGVEAGKGIPVDGIIAIVGEPGTNYQALLAPAASAAPAAVQTSAAPAPVAAAPAATAAPAAAPSTTASSDSERTFVSPLARKMAKEKGIDLAQVKGSGEGGRIIRRDIETFQPVHKTVTPAASAQTATPAFTPGAAETSTRVEGFRDEPVTQMRKTIARRLSESMYTAPHFYLTIDIDMDKAIAARASMNEVSPVKISFNDIVIRAAAAALRQHPKVRASWMGDKIRYYDHVHVGVAVAVEEGLLVPVIRFADSKPLSQIAAEVRELGKKAKEKKLQPADWEGSTFTISNLGMFGIEEFTAIINPPDSCIMAVGGIRQVPVVKDGQIVPGNMMKVTLSCDHRIVDGAVGSAFLQTFKQYMEDPVRILV